MKVLGLASVLFVSLHLSQSKSLPNADSSAEPGQEVESHDTAYNSIISKYYTTDPFFLEQYDIVEAEAEPLHMEFEKLPYPDDSERDTSRDNSQPFGGPSREEPKAPTRIISAEEEDDLSKEAFKPHVREKKEIPKVRMHVAKKPYKKVMIKKVMRPVSHRHERIRLSSQETRPERQAFSQLLSQEEDQQEKEDIQSQGGLQGLSRKPNLANSKRSRKVETRTNKDEDFSKDFGPRQKKLPGEDRGDIPELPFIENAEIEDDPQNVIYTGAPGGPPSKSYFDLMGDFFDEPQINIYPDEFVPPPSKESVPSAPGRNQFSGPQFDNQEPSRTGFETKGNSNYNDFKREIPHSQLKLSFENSGEAIPPHFESFKQSPKEIKSNHLDSSDNGQYFTPPKYHPYAEPLSHPNPLDLDHIPEDVQIYEQPIPHKVEIQKPNKPSLDEEPKLRSISAHNFGYQADEFTPDNVELDFLKLNAVSEFPTYSNSMEEAHAPSSMKAPDFFKYAHDFEESKPVKSNHNQAQDPPRFREIADVVPSFEEFGVFPFDNLEIDGPLVPKEHRSLPMDENHPSLKFANSFNEDEKKPFGPINHKPDSSVVPEHFEEEPKDLYNPFKSKPVQEEVQEQYLPFEHKPEPEPFVHEEVKEERYNPFEYKPDFEHVSEHKPHLKESYDPYSYKPESNHISEYSGAHRDPYEFKDFPSSTFSEEEFVMPNLPPPPEMEKAMRESNFEMRVPTLGARITFNPSMPLFDSFHSGIHSNDIHRHTKKAINPKQRSIDFFNRFDHQTTQYQNDEEEESEPEVIILEEPKFSDEGDRRTRNPDLPANFRVVEPTEDFVQPEEDNAPSLDATRQYLFPAEGASPPRLDESFDEDNFGPNPFKRYESSEVEPEQRRYEGDFQKSREVLSSPFDFGQESRYDESESFQLPSPEDFFKGLDRPGPFGDGFNSFITPSPAPVSSSPVRFPPKKEYSTPKTSFFDKLKSPKRKNTKAPVYVPKPNTLYQHEPKVASNRRISSPMNVDEPGFHQFSTQFQRRSGMPIIPPEDLMAVEERGEQLRVQPRNIHVRSIDEDAIPKMVLPSPRLNPELHSRASHGRALFGVSSDLEFNDDPAIQEPHQFINVENYDQFKAGFNRGNPYHHVQDVQEHLGHNHREEVSWADSDSGYGKHYYEFNHGDHKYKMYHQHE